MHNKNHATFHIMPHVVTHAMNTNDVMCTSCDMHALASKLSLDIYAQEMNYWHAICMS